MTAYGQDLMAADTMRLVSGGALVRIRSDCGWPTLRPRRGLKWLTDAAALIFTRAGGIAR